MPRKTARLTANKKLTGRYSRREGPAASRPSFLYIIVVPHMGSMNGNQKGGYALI